MKLFPTPQTRNEYLDTQIQRSENKFNYCKVSVNDVATYRRGIDRASGASVVRRGTVVGPGPGHGPERGRVGAEVSLQPRGTAGREGR